MLVGLSILVTLLALLISTRWRMWSWPFSQASQAKNIWSPGTTEECDDNSRRDNSSAANGPVAGIAGGDDESPASTPKAKAVLNGTLPSVPALSLASSSDDDEDMEDEQERGTTPTLFPAANSAQRARGPAPSLSIIASTSLPNGSSKPTASRLMPPPRLPASSLRPSPSAAASLRVPSTGPLPNRGRPDSNPPRAPTTSTSLAVPPSAALKAPNPRAKVQLSAGHSPLDWAALQRSGANLSGVSGFQRVTPSVLRAMNGRKGRPAWSSYQGRVYNVGAYLKYHPGGEGELRRAAGRDGEKLFLEVHPWVNWENMLQGCLVGMLVPEEDAEGSALEQLD